MNNKKQNKELFVAGAEYVIKTLKSNMKGSSARSLDINLVPIIYFIEQLNE